MYLVPKEPIKIIREMGPGKSPKHKGLKSCPGLEQDSGESIRDQISPDFSFAEHHPKKIQYGDKDIEV